MKNTRLTYLCAILVLIPIGLLSRRIGWFPDACGDALWSMMVFCCWRIVLVRSKLSVVAIASLISAYAVEFSQLVKDDWLDRFRATFVGHMMLGQGFLWTDLVADTAGIAIIFVTFALFCVNTHHQ